MLCRTPRHRILQGHHPGVPARDAPEGAPWSPHVHSNRHHPKHPMADIPQAPSRSLKTHRHQPLSQCQYPTSTPRFPSARHPSSRIPASQNSLSRRHHPAFPTPGMPQAPPRSPEPGIPAATSRSPNAGHIAGTVPPSQRPGPALTFSHRLRTWLSLSCRHSFSCSIHWSSSLAKPFSSMARGAGRAPRGPGPPVGAGGGRGRAARSGLLRSA